MTEGECILESISPRNIIYKDADLKSRNNIDTDTPTTASGGENDIDIPNLNSLKHLMEEERKPSTAFLNDTWAETTGKEKHTPLLRFRLIATNRCGCSRRDYKPQRSGEFFLNFSNIAHDDIFCINTLSDLRITLYAYR